MELTIPQELQERQVYGPLPVGVFLHGNAIASGGKDFARPNGDQLAAFVLARHVVEDGGIIDEGVQLPRDMPCPQDQGPIQVRGKGQDTALSTGACSHHWGGALERTPSSFLRKGRGLTAQEYTVPLLRPFYL